MGCDITEFIGKTFIGIVVENDEITFICDDLNHQQDCCEQVAIEEIVGDINDLIGHQIMDARKDTNNQFPELHYDSFLWTFYNIGTKEGYVTVRWLGHSNGYYSEEVSIFKNSITDNPIELLTKLERTINA